MTLVRRCRAGFLSGALWILAGAACRAADAPPENAPLFSAGIASEFGFTLGESLETKRGKLPPPKPQDNGNLYFIVKLPKPSGPFDQVAVAMSPKSQVVVSMRARREFSNFAACMAELQRLNEAMQSRLGVKSERSNQTQSWVFYNVEQPPVSREMSCSDKRMDFYVFDKKLVFQGVVESADAEAKTAAAQR